MPMKHPTFKYVFGPLHRPGQWGLRGDSELWDYLYATLYHVPIPREPAVAEQLVRDLIENRTGRPTTGNDVEPVAVDLCSDQHQTGMSTGYLDPGWWRDRGLPHIRAVIAEELQATDNVSDDAAEA
jgi:hypothetical protein